MFNDIGSIMWNVAEAHFYLDVPHGNTSPGALWSNGFTVTLRVVSFFRKPFCGGIFYYSAFIGGGGGAEGASTPSKVLIW